MTKYDILYLDQVFHEFFINGDQELMEPFKYLILKNRFRFKAVVDEKTSMMNNLLEGIDIKKEDIDEYLKSSPEFTSFLNEEAEVKFYTIDISELKDKKYDSKFYHNLWSTGFITDNTDN